MKKVYLNKRRSIPRSSQKLADLPEVTSKQAAIKSLFVKNKIELASLLGELERLNRGLDLKAMIFNEGADPVLLSVLEYEFRHVGRIRSRDRIMFRRDNEDDLRFSILCPRDISDKITQMLNRQARILKKDEWFMNKGAA